MGDRTAFFYGTLMAPPVLNRVVNGTSTPTAAEASRFTVRPAILHHYCRRRVREVDYPGIVPEEGHTVRGTLVCGLTSVDIWRLDQFEGDEYTRKKVTVRPLVVVGDAQGQGNVEGETVEAETYEFTAGLDRLEDGEWDFQRFKEEKMHRWTESRIEYQGKFCVAAKARSNIMIDVDPNYGSNPGHDSANLDPTRSAGLSPDVASKMMTPSA